MERELHRLPVTQHGTSNAPYAVQSNPDFNPGFFQDSIHVENHCIHAGPEKR